MIDPKVELKTEVMLPDDSDAELKIIYESDVLEFRIDGKEVFSGDWNSNFMELFDGLNAILKNVG